MKNKKNNLILRTNYHSIQRRKIKSKKRFYSKPGFINTTFIISALVCVLGISYLCAVNNRAVKGYEIKDLEKEIAELEKQNKQLRIKKAELNSLYKIEKEREDLKMSVTQPEEIVYIKENNRVAFK